MKIITQLVILTLSLLLVNANQYCDNLATQCKINFQRRCSYQTVPIENCCDLKVFPAPTGVYKLNKATFDVNNAYCDMTTDGGGWIVIQRNKKNSLVSFNRNWNDYEKGFGDLHTEFWYGLESMHCLTQRGQWEMRVDYQKNDKTWSYYHYNQFSVGSASEEYPLTIGGFTGVGTDWFNRDLHRGHNGTKFSTPDNDNDKYGSSTNCAATYNSGWWYNSCYYINLNKQPPSDSNSVAGNILFTEIKIRPRDCNTY